MRTSPTELSEPSSPATSGGWVAFPPWLEPDDVPTATPPPTATPLPIAAPHRMTRLAVAGLVLIGAVASWGSIAVLVALLT